VIAAGYHLVEAITGTNFVTVSAWQSHAHVTLITKRNRRWEESYHITRRSVSCKRGRGSSSGLELGKYGIGSGTIENGTVRGVRSKCPPPPRTRRDERFGGGERDQKKIREKILWAGKRRGFYLRSSLGGEEASSALIRHWSKRARERADSGFRWGGLVSKCE
jgi:hypothetical protein